MEENKGKSRFLWMHKAMLIAFMDGLIVLSSYFMALLMRFDFIFSQIPQEYIAGYLWSMPFWITSTIVVFMCSDYITVSGDWQAFQSFRCA